MIAKILENKNLGNAFILTIERNGLLFKTGMHVNLSLLYSSNKRPYSIYSGENDDHIELLIKEIDDGVCTPSFRKLKPGDEVEISEASGTFTLEEKDINKNIFLIATGSGIAPFHSFIKTYPDINYTLIHGVKTADDCYEFEKYNNYVACVTRSEMFGENVFPGRVTKYFEDKVIDTNAIYYLCGLGEMIYEMDDILVNKGVFSQNIHWEIYHAHRI